MSCPLLLGARFGYFLSGLKCPQSLAISYSWVCDNGSTSSQSMHIEHWEGKVRTCSLRRVFEVPSRRLLEGVLERLLQRLSELLEGVLERLFLSKGCVAGHMCAVSEQLQREE